MIFRIMVLFLSLLLPLLSYGSWDKVLSDAKGERVHFYAWGGSDLYNSYISWAADEVERLYGVSVEHVKLSDTSEAVRQVIAERAAGVGDSSGGIDVIWINGENFASMKHHELLYGPFVDDLPNFGLVDVDANPSVIEDFTIPTAGLEAPWGMAQLIFMYDTELGSVPGRTPSELLSYAKEHRGRITYPSPPDFSGTSFLKQLLIALLSDSERKLLSSSPSDVLFDRVSTPLWFYLDELTPYLMRGGKVYPKSGEEMLALLDNGDIDMAFSFNVGAVASSIEDGLLPSSVRPYVWSDGSLANSHFLAIPYNSKSKSGSKVFINFLLSAEAQSRKSDVRYWGEPSVLSYGRLSESQRHLFDVIERHEATLSASELGSTYAEPHPDWVERIEKEWLKRYADY